MGEERKTPSKIASLCFTAPPAAEPAAACSATPPARWRSGGGRGEPRPYMEDLTLDQECRGGARRVKQTSRGLVCSPSGEQTKIATWDCPARRWISYGRRYLSVGAAISRPLSGSLSTQEGTRTLRWAQYLSCAWQERYWIERTAYEI